MAKDVIITPANGKVDFLDATGNTDGIIQLDDSGNLKITNPGGDLSIGDVTSDLYIGDGINSVDIIFEQNGAIRGLTGKTLTLGQSDSFVAFAGNVTNGLRVSSGNVSIGTTNTSAAILTVQGTTSPVLRLVDTSAGGDVDMQFIPADTANTWTIGIDDSDADKFKIAEATTLGTAKDYLTIDVNGNVGIGTASPTANLHVIGTANLAAPSTTAASLTFGAAAGQILRNESGEFAFGLHNGSPFPLYIQGRYTGNIPRNIVINPLGGSVGIGGSNYLPTSNLHVTGTANVTANLTLGAGAVGSPSLTTAGDDNTGIFFPAADTIAFTEGGTEVLRVTSTSNVGIGTTVAGEKLHVIGSANVSANLFSTTHSAVQTTATISAGTLTLNLNNATVFEVNLNANITTITVSNPKATTRTSSFVLIFVGDGTARSITWPAAFKFPDGSAPSVTSTNGKRTIFTVVSYDGGTNWYAIRSGANF